MSEVFEFSTSQKIRIDEYLRKELPQKLSQELRAEISNSKIRRLILAGAIQVNGRLVFRPSFELRGNSKIKVTFEKDKFFFEKQPDDIKFQVSKKDILFEDENLIFVNKPAFFPVEQTIVGNRDNLHDSLVDYLWKQNPELKNPPYVGIMHRLDRGTSGVILFSKNRSINKAVSQMFSQHRFTKKYLALVEKNPNYKVGDSFTVEFFMGRISSKSQTGKWGKVKEEDGGDFSKSDFKILKECRVENKDCFLIECNLFTGRTHQIRLHLSSKGLPILGDELYGGKIAKRIYLHSQELSCECEDLNLHFKVIAPCDFA
ncbi:MAG: RluA family pseudouridine synthase [Treponema sp.]|nr:RluA family pseudouridine synthase [Treponema sp.]